MPTDVTEAYVRDHVIKGLSAIKWLTRVSAPGADRGIDIIASSNQQDIRNLPKEVLGRIVTRHVPLL